jgi:hypothetical protein
MRDKMRPSVASVAAPLISLPTLPLNPATLKPPAGRPFRTFAKAVQDATTFGGISGTARRAMLGMTRP